MAGREAHSSVVAAYVQINSISDTLFFLFVFVLLLSECRSELRSPGANRIMSAGFPSPSESYERGSQWNVLFPEAWPDRINPARGSFHRAP